MMNKAEIFKKIKTGYLNLSSRISKLFEFLENTLEFFILLLAFLPLLPSEVTNKRMLRDKKVEKKQLGSTEHEIGIAEIYINKMLEEYLGREVKLENKAKSLTSIISLAFTFIFSALVYIFKDLKTRPDIFFYISVILMFVALYCILIFYKVSNFNKVTFTETDFQGNMPNYLSDVLFCVESNHQRLDYFVTVYKASLRYFIASLIFLLFAMIRQFVLNEIPCYSNVFIC